MKVKNCRAKKCEDFVVILFQLLFSIVLCVYCMVEKIVIGPLRADRIRGKGQNFGVTTFAAKHKTLTNHAAYLNYIDNFRNKQRTKKIISDMKSKLNVDMF